MFKSLLWNIIDFLFLLFSKTKILRENEKNLFFFLASLLRYGKKFQLYVQI